MSDELLRALSGTRGIDAWKIVEHRVEGRELFLIGGRVDMRRAKTVRRAQLTLYRDGRRGAQPLRGSMTLSLPGDCRAGELKRLVRQAAEAARWVENPHFPLVRPGLGEPAPPASAYAPPSVDLDASLELLAEALLAAESPAEPGRLNSAELFLETIQTRIRNSEGVDVGFSSFRGSGELIVEARDEGSEVELYQELDFAQAEPGLLQEEARRQLQLCGDRLRAQPTPALGASPLLLTGEAVPALFEYFLFHASAESAYNGLAGFAVGGPVQGRETPVEALDLELTPHLAHSSRSRPWDEDGWPLRPAPLVRDGRLLRCWGSVRHCHYLGVPPTGNLPNPVSYTHLTLPTIYSV